MVKVNCNRVEKLILNYVNKSRSKCGLSKLKMDPGLRRIARKHSGKMAKRGRIWHGNGVTVAKENIEQGGILNFIFWLLHAGTSGENIGLMPLGQVRGFKRKIKTAKDVAFAQHKTWMKSPGHRANVLNNRFSLIGIGVTRNRNRFFCTELFYG